MPCLEALDETVDFEGGENHINDPQGCEDDGSGVFVWDWATQLATNSFVSAQNQDEDGYYGLRTEDRHRERQAGNTHIYTFTFTILVWSTLFVSYLYGLKNDCSLQPPSPSKDFLVFVPNTTTSVDGWVQNMKVRRNYCVRVKSHRPDA